VALSPSRGTHASACADDSCVRILRGIRVTRWGQIRSGLLTNRLAKEARKVRKLGADTRPSIDMMFEAAAHVLRDHVLAVLLTGANAHGAAALQAVRTSGGITVVQDPATAFGAAMTAAAVGPGPLHVILGLDALRALLATPP
jgi:chemotaxis response regulator CheB